MAIDEDRTDHIFFAKFFEELVDDVAEIHLVLFQFDMELLADGFRFFQCDIAEILAGLFVDRIGHIDALERCL